AGIRVIGAGSDAERARAPAVLEHEGFRLAVVACSDHPVECAAGKDRPGIAYADLEGPLPDWLGDLPDADAVLVTPHWGPNMTAEPVPHVRRAADALLEAGTTLIAGHSAHVFHDTPAGRLRDALGLDGYAVSHVRLHAHLLGRGL